MSDTPSPPRKLPGTFQQIVERFPDLAAAHDQMSEAVDRIGGATCEAIRKLRRTGAVLLNQAVLLRGVNDSVDALEELCLRLVNEQVIPYYLHQLDRVAGAAHFEVPVQQGLEWLDQLRQRLPGYAVPRYVQEVEGRASKTSLEQHVG